MQNLEQQIAKMKLEERGQAVEDIERERAAVIGGLKELANLEKSETWVRDKLWTLWAPMPTEVYCRGDFKGVVFAKFGSKDDRDAAVKALKKAGLKEHGHEVWAKEDLPIEFRAPKRLLLGLKYLFVNKWSMPGARVDEAMTELTVGGKTVLSARVIGNKLDLEWAQAWGAWKELVDDQEVKDLISVSTKMLEGAKGKAKGKGEKGGGGD